MKFRVRKQSGWDVDTQTSSPAASVLTLQALTAHQNLTKPAREIYLGNMNPSHSSSITIKQFFSDIFNLLPEYKGKYGILSPYGPIRDVKVTAENATFSFVEFWTEELAATALLMDKVEFYGRLLKVGRPVGYDLSQLVIPPPMDVSVLRAQGILPPEIGLSAETRRARQVYVGNLSEKFTVQIIRDLFEPACRKLPEFNPILSSAVVNVEMHDRFAFVELQNEAMAASVLGLFNNVEVLGRRIFVGKAQPGLGVANAAKIGALLASGPAGAATAAALTAAKEIFNNK